MHIDGKIMFVDLLYQGEWDRKDENLKFLKLCLSVGSTGVLRLKEGVQSPKAEITGACEPLEVGARN